MGAPDHEGTGGDVHLPEFCNNFDRSDIVSNMHEAYSQIQTPDLGYGCFISGTSKTADIAQALVMGAQAAREVTVVII